MRKITINTEAGPVEITTQEQAIKMITSTSYAQGFMSVDEMMQMKEIKQLSEIFQINLSNFKRAVVEDIGAHDLGFGPTIMLHYPDSEPNAEVMPTVLLLNTNGLDASDSLDLLISNGVIPLAHEVYFVPSDNNMTDLSKVMSEIINHTNTTSFVVLSVLDEGFFDFYKTLVTTRCLNHYFDYGFITAVADESDEVIEIEIVRDLVQPGQPSLNRLAGDIDASALYA